MNNTYAYVYNFHKEELKSSFVKSRIRNVPLVAPTYCNAVVMPIKRCLNLKNEPTALGGVEDVNGEFIDGTNFQTRTEIGYHYDNHDICHKDVVYIGLMHSCYGHMITDSIAKLWYLQTEEYKNKKLPLLYISDVPLKKWQYEILELAGVDLNKLITVDNVTRFNSIIVPDNSQIRNPGGEHYWSNEFRMTLDFMISRAIERVPVNDVKKVYFTRTKWNRVYDDYGEEMIEPLFKKAGYKIYSPESYSVAQQIALMQGADEMVSTDCSSAHNAIFMRPGSKMVLLRKGLFINYYSVMINEVCKLQTTVIDCSMSILNRNGQFAYAGPFFIYPNNNLCKFLKIKRKEFPYYKFRKYIRGVWRRTLPESLIMENVYAIEMMKEIQYTKEILDAKLLDFIPKFIQKHIIRKLRVWILNYKLGGIL